ncbi:hypothetical protein [Nonomuraea dietziae]
MAAQQASSSSEGLPIGANVPSFTTTTVDGEPISQDLLTAAVAHAPSS